MVDPYTKVKTQKHSHPHAIFNYKSSNTLSYPRNQHPHLHYLPPSLLAVPQPMDTLNTETPYPNTTKLKDQEKDISTMDDYVDEEELCPVEEVRLTVANTDDPSLPIWTFRMWFLGLLSCALLSFLDQFFAYRTEPLIITQITVQVATLPIGRFMASVLPQTKFRIPGFGSRTFSFNPGPFNIKEHVLISIFANAGSAFGSGSAYAVGIVTIIKAFYHRKISFFAGWLLITTTQVIINSLHSLSVNSLSLLYN